MRLRFVFALPAILAGLSGCLGGSSGDPVVVEGDFPVAFVQRDLSAIGNPTDGAIYVPGGDLILVDLASPSADKKNITATIVQGPHDVSDPEVSYDGKRLLFAMKAPQWQNNSTWNLFEYDTESRTLTRLITDETLANAGDDVDPAYLPDGRIVFSSNRQAATRKKMNDEGKVQPYAYRDEYEREATIVLHVLEPSSQAITQISFNQSHDRNPTVLMSGEILFARWDHVGNRNHFPLFTTNPDGTGIFIHYGAFSPGNSFLHPREMPDGRVMSDLMPLSRTHEGGAVMIVDVKNFTDNDQPANDTATGKGQVQARPEFPASTGREYSVNGRYTTPYPLWDGTNRALVAFKTNPRPEDAQTEINALGEAEPQESPPRYGIYMLDLDTDQLRPIALPDPGGNMAYTDPVALIPRDAGCRVSRPDGCLPTAKADKLPKAERLQVAATTEETLAKQGLAILNVKSVYDTDSQGLMGDSMLVAGEGLPKTAEGLPDLARMKDPNDTAYAQRVARFIRVTRAVPTPPGMSREQIGEFDFEMQQILGYAPIEPDGSFKIQVPADTPIGVVVVDRNGRALQTHTNWIQARPGETRTCNGCHSPRRGSALNASPIAGDHRDALSGESMAETRTRLLAANDATVDIPAMALSRDMYSEDYWNPTPGPALAIDYAGLTTPSPVDSDGVITINYPDHIQPLWEKACIGCHDSTTFAADLDLSGGTGGFGRMTSYQELTIGDPVLDQNGLPIITIDEDGEVMMEREAPLVDVGSSRQSSRSSHLMEVLYHTELRASRDLPATPTVDHSGMLNASELRLIAEWIDLGAQYYNDPFENGADSPGSEGGALKVLNETRGGLQGLDQEVFDADVQPILLQRCGACHQAFGNTGTLPDLNAPNPQFIRSNRFVLTGNPDGDFNVTVGMVSDVCNRQDNELLLRPVSDSSGAPSNPMHPLVNGVPVLDATGQEYHTILNWITAAATDNGC